MPYIYWPPVTGKTGGSADDWIGGSIPGDLGAAIDLSQIMQLQLIDSQSGYPITNENFQPVTNVDRTLPVWNSQLYSSNSPLTIKITGGAIAPTPTYTPVQSSFDISTWINNNWKWALPVGLIVLMYLTEPAPRHEPY